ncbi:glycosyltransferase [Lacipirellula parvula]|uniref:Glycosyltransferase n=1 Tax=Lacipirellula parvula TaxID=2650471 RepID=A0A5K7XF95_9BACT|nr:glycosyltransferase [Lacipirellula parvula]BBO33006.1 glycosyltransferase [Lacipirellula parvula]
MRVLLCHSYYTQRGGEDRSFEEERELLQANGHEVIEYVRRNEELVGRGKLAAAATTLWNRQAGREVAAIIERHRPDVLHATNTFPLISPSVCDVAHRAGVAVVQALRNYRLLCANSYLMRDGQPCEACVGKAVPLPAIQHRCYRDSAAASAVVAAMQVYHRTVGVWRNRVDAFFTLTHFARQKFVDAGLPADRVHVKYNSVSPDPGVGDGSGGYAVFVGRLSPEKGVGTVLAAWEANRELPPLVIVGDGPLRAAVEAAASRDARITIRGELSNAEAQRVIGAANLLVMPSLWYETFGRTIAEAYATGTPVVASRLGAMAELVEEGVAGSLFNPGHAADLAQRVAELTLRPADEQQAIRRRARQAYEQQFTPAHNYRRLLEIYEIALTSARERCGASSHAAKASQPNELSEMQPQAIEPLKHPMAVG